MTIKKQVARRSLVQQAIDIANAAGSPVVFAEFDGCPHLESAHRRGLLSLSEALAKRGMVAA